MFGIVLGLLTWTALAFVFPQNLMPGPLTAMSLTWELVESGSAWRHLSATLWRTLWGFIGAMIVGVGLGVLMGINNFGRQFLVPYVIIGFAIPTIGWAAAMTLIFGFRDLSPIAATVVVVFPFVAVNIWKGVENIDNDLVQMSQAFGVSNGRLLLRMILPNTAPSLFAANRFGLATAWKIVTITEMFASSSGVGYMIIQTFQYFQYQNAWAWAILFMIVILAIEYAIFKPLERRAFRYRQDADFTIIG